MAAWNRADAAAGRGGTHEVRAAGPRCGHRMERLRVRFDHADRVLEPAEPAVPAGVDADSLLRVSDDRRARRLAGERARPGAGSGAGPDRKSTRLNSSH